MKFINIIGEISEDYCLDKTAIEKYHKQKISIEELSL